MNRKLYIALVCFALSALVDLIEARQRLGEEIADTSAVLMFLADSTAALYQPNRKPVNQ